MESAAGHSVLENAPRKPGNHPKSYSLYINYISSLGYLIYLMFLCIRL